MKKIIPVLLIILLYQSIHAQKHALGLRIGANISNMSLGASDGMSTDRKIGVLAGIVSEIRIARGFSICPELYYSQQGYSESLSTLSSQSGHFSVNYINLPVLLRGSISTNNLRFYINAGPQLGIYTNGSIAVSSSTSSTGLIDISMPADFIKPYDFSAVVGVGMGIKVGNGEIIIDARYTAGLKDVSDSDLKYRTPYNYNGAKAFTSLKNNVIAISVGYSLYLTKSK